MDEGIIKAFWVQFRGDEWGSYIHAESAGIAKAVFYSGYPGTDVDLFTEIRAYRRPKLDGKPFTDNVMREHGYRLAWDEEDENDMPEDSWLEFCNCDICRNIDKSEAC